jgi:hypothetical protein
MTPEQAISRIALAGRELGSGPFAAVDRIVPGMADKAFEQAKRRSEKMHERMIARGHEPIPFNEFEAQQKARAYAYGVAVGLVIAEDRKAMQVLDDIEQEWRELHA